MSPQSEPRWPAFNSRSALALSMIASLLGAIVAAVVVVWGLNNPASTPAPLLTQLGISAGKPSPAPAQPFDDPRLVSGKGWAKAEAGQCLSWFTDSDGAIEAFSIINCDQPHRFEIAQRVDLAQAEPSLYADGVPFPSPAARELIGTNHCVAAVNAYIGTHGPLDPNGRFTVGIIPPNEKGWNRGDHSVLCGIQSTELDGSIGENVGTFAESDQHRLWPAGTCLGFAPTSQFPGPAVQCSEDHSVEMVSIENISDFVPPTGFPAVNVQLQAMNDRCFDAAVEYAGGPEALRVSTLITGLVAPISQASWESGSRDVNCGLFFPATPGPYARLRESIRGPLLINGLAPVVPTTTQIRPPTPPIDGVPIAGQNGA